MPDYLQGYATVPDSGTQLPTPCGTEEANEGPGPGTATKGWAKRKFKAGPVEGDDEKE